MSQHVEVRRDDGVEEVVFARPAKNNALTLDMYAEAADALREASIAGDVRCVLLRGAGDHFTSGNDLNDFLNDPPGDETSPVFQDLMALRQCASPVIAAVDGYAIGIGTTMLLHCDLVWASPEARFRLPFVDLGLVPEAGSSVLLPAISGHRKAAEMLYFGGFFDVQMARQAGIINGVVEGDVGAFARRRALELVEKPPLALQLTKELLRKADDEAVEAAMRHEAAIFVRRLQSDEFLEAVAEFQG